MSWKSFFLKSVAPFLVFLAAFSFYEGFFFVYASCDCFFNYREIVAMILVVLNIFGQIILNLLLVKKQKIYRIWYSVFAVILFLVTYFLSMTIGEWLYSPIPFR